MYSPGCIWNEVYAIDPNFPWHSEFILHYLRKTDKFYNKYSNVIRVLAGRSVAVTINPSGIVITGRDLNDIRSKIIAIHPNAQCSQDSVVIYDTQFTRNDVFNCMFLLSPRPYPNMIKHNISPRRRSSVPEEQDYPYLIHHLTPQDLRDRYPSIFPEIPTDLEIIRAILSLADYNVNSLLKWLEMRSTIQLYLKNGTSLQVHGLDIDDECISLYNELSSNPSGRMTHRSYGIVKLALAYYSTDLIVN